MKRHASVFLFLFIIFILLFVYINISRINNNIAVSDFDRGDFNSALVNFKRAVGFQNREQISKYNLANTNSKVYEHQEARKIYNELLSRENISPELKSEIYFNLGNIECMYENFDKALEYYYMALTLNSEDEEIKFNIELVEYINRPIIYNDEILLFPKQKIEEQMSVTDKALEFKNKIKNEILTGLDSSYISYYEIENKGTFEYKQIIDSFIPETEKIKKSFSDFNRTADYFLKKSKYTVKPYDDKIKEIKDLVLKSSKETEKYEAFEYNIIKKLVSNSGITRNELYRIMSDISFKDNIGNTVNLSTKYNFAENEGKDISVEARDVLHMINEVQYFSFVQNYFMIVSEIENLLMMVEDDFDDGTLPVNQIVNIVKTAGDMWNKEIIHNKIYFDKYMDFISGINRDLSCVLGNKTLERFIRDIKDNKNYKITYDKATELWEKVYKYNISLININLLFDSINERAYVCNNSLKHIVSLIEKNRCFNDESLKDLKDAVKTNFSEMQGYSEVLKNNKQIYDEISIKNTAYINILFKILSDKFYSGEINSDENKYIELKKYFEKQKEIFNKKEADAAEKKLKMKSVAAEIKELDSEILAVNKDSHMYVSVAEAEKTLKNRENIKKDELKEYEIELIKDIKTFIRNFTDTLTYETNKFKLNLDFLEKLLKKTLSLNEFEQKNTKSDFLREKSDLEFELLNFETVKKYSGESDLKKIMLENFQTDNLISKTLYQREKLDRLLKNEQLISKQAEELNRSRDNLLNLEKEELVSLEKDLVEKQLTLVKYYVTIEDDTTKKSLTRDIMQSLYKGKYKTDKEISEMGFGFEFVQFSDLKNAVLQLYKMSVFQVRELNKFIYRMKIINAILELEYTSKLKQRIDFNRQNLKGKNVQTLQKELDNSRDFIKKNKQSETKEIIKIFKENLVSAEQLKERLVAFHEKQYKIKKDALKEKISDADRKLKILNEKIEALSEHVKYKNSELNTKEDIEKMKEEIENAKKEQEKLSSYRKKAEKNMINMKKELNVDEIMFGVMQSSDLMLDKIDKNGERNSDIISKSDRDRIMFSQSGRDKAGQKKLDHETFVKNDW